MRKGKIIARAADAEEYFTALYGENTPEQKARYDRLIGRFYKEYGKYGYMASSGGRVEVVGNHTDHNGGKAVGCAISLDTVAMFLPAEDGKIVVKSEGYPDVVVDISSHENAQKGTSDALVAGILEGFEKRGYKTGGFVALTTSNVSGGAGVSSSAAFEILICEILNFLYNDGKMSEKEKVFISQYAENVRFGKPCGLLDQSAIAFGGITLLDFAEEGNVEATPVRCDLSAYTLVLIETGGDHKHLTGEYAAITEEMAKVSAFFGKKRLIEVDEGEFYDRLPELKQAVNGRAIGRAVHFYEENKRVEKLAVSLEKGDFAGFLSAVNESGVSSQTLLQNIFPSGDTDQPISLALAAGKRYLNGGANRVHGGGFAGTTLNVLKNADVPEFLDKMSKIFGKDHVIPLKVRTVGTIVL